MSNELNKIDEEQKISVFRTSLFTKILDKIIELFD